MAMEYREDQDYFFGTLSAAAAGSDTALSSAAFTPLGAHYSTGTPGYYVPVVLHDPAIPAYEVVYIVGHTASSTTVTVQRGKEGSTARSWPANTQVLCAPTRRDALTTLTRANLPGDPHVGYRNAVSDEGIVVERTHTAGWQPSVGVANPGDFGNRLGGTAIPSSGALIMRGDRFTGTTDSTGRVVVTFKVPFPNQCLTAVTTWGSGGGSSTFGIGVETYTESNMTVFLYNTATGADGAPGLSITFNYIAVGY